MKARHFSLLATLCAMALTQACSDDGSGAAGSALAPEITTQTVSNATPEARAQALATLLKITRISGVVDPKVPTFANSLGSPDNLSEAGFHAQGRRQINWDGVPASFSDNNNFPEDFFNVNSPRGAIYDAENGTGLRVSSNHFADLAPTNATDLIPFSEPKLFAPVGTKTFELKFRIPGSNTRAVVKGFGAIVVDVDKAQLSRLKAFDKDDHLIANIAVPVRKNPDEYSLVGVTFTQPVIAKVQLILGDTPPKKGVKDISSGGTKDVVALDDFLYSEPQRIQ
ncbi:MAG TPA: hypothetical protein VHR43_01400 [Gemmatimonadales bacterium]|jgi:hypothetical protein|nr:hypothetical protein [Gemmatimonadales bacterium]